MRLSLEFFRSRIFGNKEEPITAKHTSLPISPIPRDKDQISSEKQSIPEQKGKFKFRQVRERNQQRFMDSLLHEPTNEHWTFNDGNYANHGLDIVDKSESSESSLNSLLGHMEQMHDISLKRNEIVIAALIYESLAKNKKTKCTDVGGMLGTSWLRLGIYFQEEIQSGALELIVTNVHYDPTPFRDDVKRMPDDTISQAFKRPFIEGAPFVRFIHANTDDIVDVIGTSDIIYDYDASTYHSATPADERLRLLKALNPGGILLSEEHLSPLAPSRYRAMRDASDSYDIGPSDFEDKIKAERKAELVEQKGELESSQEYQIVNDLILLGEQIHISDAFLVARKR